MNGFSPIQIAAGGPNTALLEVMLKHNGDPNLPGPDQVTPLMAAAQRNQPENIKLLLRYAAPVDARDSLGNTALHHAVRSYAKDSIAVLIEAGADPDAKGARGLTPMDHARIMGFPELLK